jgi:hypothetical protein
MVNERFYPFCEDETSTYVIFPYDTSLEENTPIVFSELNSRFPLAGQYLSRHKDTIISNVETCEGDENWHLFTRVQNHKAVYPKILLPMTANDTYATITQNSLHYCDNANMFFIEIPNKSERNLYAIAGIINSTLFSVLARSIALSQQNGYFKFNKQFIEPIPFPKSNFNSDEELVHEISVLARSIDEKQNQYKRASPRQKNTLKNLLETEWNTLDSKTYKLYELTDEQVSFFNSRGRNVNRIEILDRL